jgi:hypothetical protein
MGKSRLVAEVIRLVNLQQVIGYGGECQSEAPTPVTWCGTTSGDLSSTLTLGASGRTDTHSGSTTGTD